MPKFKLDEKSYSIILIREAVRCKARNMLNSYRSDSLWEAKDAKQAFYWLQRLDSTCCDSDLRQLYWIVETLETIFWYEWREFVENIMENVK